MTTWICAWCHPPGSPTRPEDRGDLTDGICAWHRGMQRLVWWRERDARAARLTTDSARTPVEGGEPMKAYAFAVYVALLAFTPLMLAVIAYASDGGGD